MENILDNLTKEELLKLDVCIDNHFCSFYVKGVLKGGQSEEENKKYMAIYGKILNYFVQNTDIKYDPQVVKDCINKKIKQKQNESCSRNRL